MLNQSNKTMNNTNEQRDLQLGEFSGIKLMLASPEIIAGWSHGEVLKPETINYRTFKPEKDGLFDERIFGPTKDYECYCGKYKRIRYKGIVCDRCGVEVTTAAVRRERMGHIKLASPIAHIWYFKGPSAPLAVIMDLSAQSLERIIYSALYLVLTVDKEKQKETHKKLEELKKGETDVEEEILKKQKEDLHKTYVSQREDLEKKLSNNEQKELAMQELDLKEKEQSKKLSNKYIEKKSQISAFYDRILKITKSLNQFDVIEEEDHLFLKEKALNGFLKVGMGSEVVYDFLTNLDLEKSYAKTLNDLAQAKGEKRNKLLKKARVLE